MKDLFYRTECVITSGTFQIFCDHTEELWFNPITCQAQREIRGLWSGFLQTESQQSFTFDHFDTVADTGSYGCHRVHCAALKITHIDNRIACEGSADTDDE